MGRERYEQNRIRVCEIYGVDPETATVHHIVEKSDVKRTRNPFDELYNRRTIDEVQNLFPFSDEREDADEIHARWRDHARLHKELDQIEGNHYTPQRRKKRRR